MPGEKREKKLTKVVIVHYGTDSLKDVKTLERAMDDNLHPEHISCRRRTTSIEKLIECTESVDGESIRGVCVLSEELLELLHSCPKEKRQKFEDGLLKESSKSPSFVCLKYKLNDEVDLKAVLPGIARNADRMLNLELEDPISLCVHIYQQWFGIAAYVDGKGYHCVVEDRIDKPVNCVHIIHAGEDKHLLRDLSDALENIANPECSCEFRRRYREGDDIKTKMLADVKAFVASLDDEQNKCLIIVSDRLIEELKETPELEDIKRVLIQDCFIPAGRVPNFVLLKMKDNDIFDDSTFMSIKLRYHNEQKTIAEDALNIWFKPIRSPSESYYSSGEQLEEVRRQMKQGSHHCTGGPEGKLVPSCNTSLPGCVGRNPQEGEMVVNQKSWVPSSESMSSEITSSRFDQPSQLKSHVTKCMPNGQEMPVYRDEIQKIDQKGVQTPKGHIRSENPDDLLSNPPHCQPSNLSADGNVAVNASNNSVLLDDMPRRPDLSLKRELRNNNHRNEDARTGQPSSFETGVTGDQTPDVATTAGQTSSIGTHDQQPANPSTPGGYVADPSIPGEQTGHLSTPGVGATKSSTSDDAQAVYRGTSATHAGHNPEAKLFSSLQNPGIKSVPVGTKLCLGEPGNGGNFSSFGPVGNKPGPTDEEDDSGIKSVPVGTKLCLGEPGNGGNFSSFGPVGNKPGATNGDNPQYWDTTTNTTTTDKQVPDSYVNSTESPDSKSGANGKDASDKHLVKGLNWECRKELIQRLDLPIPCVHDWRNLAGHYGVPNTTIHVWSGKMPHLSASEALLSWLGAFNPDLTIATLKQDLGNFRRKDTLKIMERYGY